MRRDLTIIDLQGANVYWPGLVVRLGEWTREAPKRYAWRVFFCPAKDGTGKLAGNSPCGDHLVLKIVCIVKE